MNVIMDAVLLQRTKRNQPDGTIIELVIWEVPAPIAGSSHSYKYRLFYGRNGIRIIGFDNERGKGDHSHIEGTERPYHFSTVERLVQDFYAAIAERTTK